MRGRRWRVRVCAVCLAAAGMAGGAAAQDEAAFAIREVDGRGDTAVAEAEGLLEPWRRALIGRSWTAAAIQEQARQLRDALRERGYPLASVRTPPADYRNGRVPFEIDAGRFGRLTLTDPDGAPFSGRWFRESQLRARLSGMAEGEPFEESVFYRHILGIKQRKY